MKPKVASIAVCQRKGKQRGLWDCENAPVRGVGCVSGVVVRDDDIVGIVSTEQEETHERLVVVPAWNGGSAQPPEIENGVEDSGGGEGSTGSLANERAAGGCVHTICRC